MAVGLDAIWDDAGLGPERKMATQVPASPLKKGWDTRVLSHGPGGLQLTWQEGALTDGRRSTGLEAAAEFWRSGRPWPWEVWGEPLLSPGPCSVQSQASGAAQVWEPCGEG